MSRARASFYAFLNIHFTHLPDERFSREMRGEGFRAALRGLERDHRVHPDIALGAGKMEAFFKETRDLDVRDLAERLGVDRTRLYRGVAPGYGPVPPYQALWTEKGEDLATLLQRISRTYAEGGFAFREGVHERVDYIGIQLDYLEQLVLKEISAREAEEASAVRMALDRQKAFFGAHVSPWVPDFVSSALTCARTDFYRGHLHMLKGFVEEEREILTRPGDDSDPSS